ncbi:MAG: trypsin-like serine protease [Myxococcales bacterium]|nr:trypsin-like serine protease [Myxococcales bacterium]MCB9749449.1 trypsin-like serine protease [Myxococcales bacterium]
MIVELLEIAATTLALASAPLTSSPQTSEPIYGGTTVPPEAWRAVVVVDFGIDLCTGTLVAPDVVLTAAHCLYSQPPPQLIEIKIGNDRSSPELVLPVESYEVHPAFCANIFECEFDLYDYAYIVLGEPAPDDAVFPNVLVDQEVWDETMYKDSLVTHVGFGYDDSFVRGVKRMVEFPIVGFTRSGLEFQAGGDGKDGCQGDSGGPVFARTRDGEWFLAGVASRGISCGEGGYFGIAHPALCWIGAERGIVWNPDDDQCGGCGCVHTDPRRHAASEGCSVTRDDAPATPLALSVIFALALARRRRARRLLSSPAKGSPRGREDFRI